MIEYLANGCLSVAEQVQIQSGEHQLHVGQEYAGSLQGAFARTERRQLIGQLDEFDAKKTSYQRELVQER